MDVDTEVYSELCQTSEMERFAKMVNGLQPLTAIAKILHLRCMTGFWIRLSGIISEIILKLIHMIREIKHFESLQKLYQLLIYINYYQIPYYLCPWRLLLALINCQVRRLLEGAANQREAFVSKLGKRAILDVKPLSLFI